eukprot:TRINITY_DN8194_c0_g2_i1.p1 TRINITY_DN8194_c0_g2~~TRINITY_DN8194_c0_g2_i1.p1  ORF type:complete len:352 (-),score=39.17 TRINITY_DN8194_c0_g2_i1:244-1299(-)
MTVADTRFCFIAEWLDPNSGILWKYQLMYFVETQEVEIFDIKNRRTFLKKCRMKEITPDLLFIGNILNIFSRQIKLVDYGDDFTANSLQYRQQRTLAVLMPEGFQLIGPLLEEVSKTGLLIGNLRMCSLSHDQAQFYQKLVYRDDLADRVSQGQIVAVEFVGEDALSKCQTAISRINGAEDQICISSHESQFDMFFGINKPQTNFDGQKSTLGIIKPHAVAHGYAGPILQQVMETYNITALELFHLDKANAAEFYEVYRGVVAPGEYNGMVEELISGPFIAFEVKAADGGDCVEGFRELCGPSDPKLGEILRPNSIRAKFGENKVRNAVHCTDLEEDGELEVQYFFDILQH